MPARPRRAILALLATLPLAATGCRALGIPPAQPKAIPPVTTLEVTQTIQRHNRNAEKVESLEATPAISDRKVGAAQGRLALVRPRDFRLSVRTTVGRQLADFGSNDREYWIWTSQSRDKEYYVGHYDAHGEASQSLVFQPEWVVEALGLRLIPEDEARTITLENGDSVGTRILVHHRKGPGEGERIKKTIVDRQTGEVREHQFFAADGKTRVARVIPSEYRSVPLPVAGESVVIPYHLQIIATPPDQEPLSMRIDLAGLKVNQIPEVRKAALFTLPDDFARNGYARVDIDELSSDRNGTTTLRETMPAPPVSSRVQLQAPVPIGSDGEARRPNDPEPLTADLPTSSPSVIQARIPRPPDQYGLVPPEPEPSQLSFRR